MEDPVVETMSPETKKWFAHAVVGMIWADGRIHQNEIKYLRGVLGFLKDKELIQSVLEMIKQNMIPPLTSLQVDINEAIAIMKHLTSISIVDEELAQSEETFLKDVAEKLNLPVDLPEKFITLAKKRLGGNRFLANLMVGEDSLDVSCFGFTESNCMIFTDRLVNPLARLTFKLRTTVEDQLNYYDPIVAEAQWCRSVKSGVAKYVVKAVLKKPITSEEGAQLVYCMSDEETVKKTFQPDFNSLLGYYIKCRVCGEKDISFWQLRSRALHANNNIFGIPCYDSAFGDKDFCDYNLYQVSVCPKCLFASNQMDFFQRQGHSIGVSTFNAKLFAPKWMSTLSQRKKLLENDDGWLYSGVRTPKQAITSYDLAIETHNHLGQLGDDNDKSDHQRKSVSFMLIQAEMLMNMGDRAQSEQLLVKAKSRLEKAFETLEREAGIRAAQLIVMISIYFKELDQVGDFLNYLNNYSRQYQVKPGSPESKILTLAVSQTTDA